MKDPLTDPYYPDYRGERGYQPKHRGHQPKHRGIPVSAVAEAEKLTAHPKHRKEDTDA